MEQYSGVKFQCHRQSHTVAQSPRLKSLNSWAWLFAELGLAPIHSTGAYGNFSCRTEDAFLISISGMIPEEQASSTNYALILSCNEHDMTLDYCGISPPSSETLMHHLIYQRRPETAAILHGHNTLLLKNSTILNIAETTHYHDYGSRELATAAARVAEEEDFFILKDHGFVALGADIDTAGRLTLNVLQRLIQLYQL